MKPVIKETNDIIYTNQINSKHLIVCIKNGYPCFVTLGPPGEILIKPVNYNFTLGNKYIYAGTLQTCVETLLKENIKVAVFHEENWKKALQWLIDNA